MPVQPLPNRHWQTYRRLLGYLAPHWQAITLVVIGFAINATTEMATAKLMQIIIDAITNDNQNYKNLFPFLIILLFLGRGVGSFWEIILVQSFHAMWCINYAYKRLKSY